MEESQREQHHGGQLLHAIVAVKQKFSQEHIGKQIAVPGNQSSLTTPLLRLDTPK